MKPVLPDVMPRKKACKVVINTSDHKKWFTPDGEHIYECRFYGNYIWITVVNISTPNEYVVDVKFHVNTKKIHELVQMSVTLAEHKYVSDSGLNTYQQGNFTS